MEGALLQTINLSAWIFGGCCTNVYALETILREHAASGLVITLAQFVLISILTWPTQASRHLSSAFLRQRSVPILRWMPNVSLFFAISCLNNIAFGYRISVPTHIIIRSGGTATTMALGFMWGKSYTPRQVVSVAILTLGVILAALGDASAKGKLGTDSSSTATFDSSVIQGCLLLFLAQILSAVMGLYVQATYAIYGPQWKENLFYSHVLSLPFFLIFKDKIRQQISVVLESPEISLGSLSPLFDIALPRQALFLFANALTQYVCIRGVNMLASRASAVGVSIVLSIRKLVSLIVSIMFFGNRLPLSVQVGAALVSLSAIIWIQEDGQSSKLKDSTADQKKRS